MNPEESTNSWTLDLTPREWQRIALQRWQSHNRGIVSVVTGGGKTLFAQLCIIDFEKNYSTGQVLIVVPTTSLLDQWYVSLREDLHVAPSDIGCYSGEEKSKNPKKINLLVINTARKVVSKLAEQADSFLIVDECHRAGSEINAKALKGDYVATLGLSATPHRQYDDGFYQFIEPALGPIIFEYDYVSAHRDGVIADFDLVNVKVNFLPDEQEEYDTLTRQIRAKSKQLESRPELEEYVKNLLRKRARVSASAKMRLPVAAKLVDRNRGKRMIIFHERVESANTLFKVLEERGHSVTIYHSGVGPEIRRNNLQLYRKGVFDVLVCCRALDEGINVPETTIAVIASSTASIRQRIQRLGRVLRPAPGKSGASIYTLYATKHEEERLFLESAKMKSVASTTWFRSGIRENG